jgi:monofunctional biosynthetic peptidoglycan transglycosylase
MMLSKERILELYLNVVEWGPGVYGAEAAAQFHYGISARRLTRDQAARLVACLPAPLERRPQEMDERAVDILERMRDMGW